MRELKKTEVLVIMDSIRSPVKGEPMLNRLFTFVLALTLSLACLLLPAGAEAPTPEPSSAPPPKGYVVVSYASGIGFLPLPAEEEYTYPLYQLLPDGGASTNWIHVTPNGMYMEDSTCANHDCVDQGEVTLENRDERLLGNMIICLPNQVVLSLLTPEELQAQFPSDIAEMPSEKPVETPAPTD